MPFLTERGEIAWLLFIHIQIFSLKIVYLNRRL